MSRQQSVYGTIPKNRRDAEGVLLKIRGDDDHYSCFVIDIAPSCKAMAEHIACC
jgi:hypothetical protein